MRLDKEGQNIWYGCMMKAALEIQDELLKRAGRHAKQTGRTLSAIVEEWFRQVLSGSAPREP